MGDAARSVLVLLNVLGRGGMALVYSSFKNASNSLCHWFTMSGCSYRVERTLPCGMYRGAFWTARPRRARGRCPPLEGRAHGHHDMWRFSNRFTMRSSDSLRDIDTILKLDPSKLCTHFGLYTEWLKTRARIAFIETKIQEKLKKTLACEQVMLSKARISKVKEMERALEFVELIPFVAMGYERSLLIP